jgi:DNA-binding LytR/AlgR family response regulator
VNLDRVAEIQPWFSGDGMVVLQSGAKLRLSRGYRQEFEARLGGRAPRR